MSTIYFPLSTNVHYWDLEELDLSLESRIKLSALLYEEVIFEDGGYTAFIGPELSVEFRIPDLDQVPDNYFEEELQQTGGEFAIEFNSVMFESKAQRRYQLSFRKMLEEKELISEPWVKFAHVGFTEKGKAQLKQYTDKEIKSFFDGKKETYFLQSHIIKSIYHDWILGMVNRWDVNFDHNHERNFRKIISFQEDNLSVAPIDFEVAFPRLPDLEIVPWEKIIEIRESSASTEFRKYISKVSRESRQAFLAGEDTNSIRYHLMELRDDQLIQELENQISTEKKTGVEIGVTLLLLVGGFIPGISNILNVVSGVKDIIEPLKDFSDDQKSLGAAFIRKQKKK